jgi:Nickel responsive protein SCO4226-like
MPKYLIERVFPTPWAVAATPEGRQQCLAMVARNADEGVSWLHSYVRYDGKQAFCVYDAPSPEAVRRTAARNGLPVDRITEVRVLDPYFYAASERVANEEPPSRSRLATRTTEEEL